MNIHYILKLRFVRMWERRAAGCNAFDKLHSRNENTCIVNSNHISDVPGADNRFVPNTNGR